MHPLAALERAPERLVLEDRPVIDRAGDAHQVLEEDPARPDREVTDLRIPHLAGREAHRLARGLQRRVRVRTPEPVERGRLRELDRISGAGGRAAPAVEDDEDYESATRLRISE